MNPQPSNALSGLRMTDRLVSPPPLPSPLPPLNSPGPHSTYPNRNLHVEGVSPWAIHPAILNRVIFHDTIFFQDSSNSRRTPAPKREWRNEGMKTSRALTPPPPLLVPGHKYPKMGGDHLYGRSDTHRCFNIYFFNPCFRVLIAWHK